MSSQLEKILTQKIELEVHSQGGLSAYTPSLKIQVVYKGQKKIALSLGDNCKYFDLASLTKVIFATTAMMRLNDSDRLHVDDRVSGHLPWWPRRSTTAAQLLSHSAGLPAWAPIYKEINKRHLRTTDQKYDFLQKFLARQKLNPKQKAIYSDLDFLLLGFLIEEGFQRDLLDSWRYLKLNDWLPSLHFNPGNKPKYERSQYAPTEKCPWRKKVLRGEVHDDNTWALGGVSGHAGLFGTIEDVTTFGAQLRRGVFGEKQKLASPKTVQRFTRRVLPKSLGDWALGYMMPTKGSSSCGRYFSAQSVGHTGFTGTSLWFDPKNDLLVTIVSNRVNPTRDNRQFVALRPRLHDLVFEAIKAHN